ncbi:phenylacetic acid degradation protein [Bordetella genomosp. 1]|uniref:Phenylacetic acid degradation protein n=1 Tax=Bordetella genomosp. 1 TaxID=1395607 RepID=A0A261S8U2_9BORD|nr:PaaI family thioesterase [Bordetella genomosp. 1]OZI33200.1 phenylacetic acid degradation protein [Bordetella genomosp. 1]
MNLEDGTFFGIRAPVIEHFGLRPHSLVDDTACAILPEAPANLNAHGTISGPAVMALLDFTLAAAVRAHDPLVLRAWTIDLAIKFLKPAIGQLMAECRCESRGRTLAFASGVVYDAQGIKVAIATGSFKLAKI